MNLDPGSLGAEDQLQNLRAVREGTRVFSAYELRDGTRIWIITEADRSVTTILLPEEYLIAMGQARLRLQTVATASGSRFVAYDIGRWRRSLIRPAHRRLWGARVGALTDESC